MTRAKGVLSRDQRIRRLLAKAKQLMGEKAAMACTAAVEDVIDEHYASQIARIESDDDLKSRIEAFRADEIALDIDSSALEIMRSNHLAIVPMLSNYFNNKWNGENYPFPALQADQSWTPMPSISPATDSSGLVELMSRYNNRFDTAILIPFTPDLLAFPTNHIGWLLISVKENAVSP